MIIGPFTVGEFPTKPLSITVLDDDGSPLNLSDYTSVTAIGDGLPPGTVTVVDADLGELQYAFTGAFATATTYTLRFALATAGGVDYTPPISFTVEPVTPASYATPADVMNLTGTQVSDQQCAQAQFVIDLVTNRTIAVSGQLRPRDLGWLRYAVAYQAAWITAHPEIFTVQDVQSISQDGLSVTWRSTSGVEVRYLSPLACRALSRVSWMRSRSIAINSDFQYGSTVDRPGWWLAYGENDEWNWVPMNVGIG